MSSWIPMIDWTISVGNIITVASVMVSVIALFVSMKKDIDVLKHDIVQIEEHQKALGEAFTQLGNILTQVAVQDNRLYMLEKSVDELRHGHGYIHKQARRNS